LIENEEQGNGEDRPSPEEEPIEEQPTPEEQQREEQGAPEEAPAEETAPDEAPAEEPPAEEALAEDAATEEDSAAEESPEPSVEEAAPAAEEAPPAEEAPSAEEAPPAEAPSGDGKQKKEEVVPGAELDPIAIETERPLDAEERARREAEAEERARRERELIGDEETEQPLAAKPAKLSGDARFLATGKRKSSVARVILMPGNGSIEVNKRKLEEYFPRAYLQSVAKQPLVQSGYEGNVDVRIRVHGGGISGQASAVRHGIARALCDVDPELRKELKRRGMLSRDARVKERRKAGLKKARKKPQFSKR
jgi:small subunit ribosomal protein S9